MTKMEQLRIDKMMRLGCCACALINLPSVAAECHHLLYGNRRLGDWFTIPLCASHHRGGQWSEAIPPKYRVSIADGRKAFTRVFPTERELWEQVQERLNLTWPEPKRVLVVNGSDNSDAYLQKV